MKNNKSLCIITRESSDHNQSQNTPAYVTSGK